MECIMNKKSLRIVIVFVIFIAVGIMWGLKSTQSNGAKYNSDAAYPLYMTKINMEEMVASNMPIIIDFGADSCIPCKEMAPVLVKLNGEMQEKARIHFVDVWEYPESSKGFPVTVLPTQVFFNADGSAYVPSQEVLQKIMGFQGFKNEGGDELVMTAHQGGLTEAQMRLILADMGVN